MLSPWMPLVSSGGRQYISLINSHFVSFLNTEMAQVAKVFPRRRPNSFILHNHGYEVLCISTMPADDLATQGAKASATIVLTWFSKECSGPCTRKW